MKYLFTEAALPEEFNQNVRKSIDDLLSRSGIVVLLGMAGVGISPFLRFLATRRDKTYIYLDVASLANITSRSLFVALGNELGVTSSSVANDQELFFLCKEKLNELSEQKPVVLIINRFDQLGKSIDASLLGNLRLLRQGTQRVSLLLSTHTPLERVAEKAFQSGNIDIFSTVMYFPPYDRKTIEALFILYTGKKAFPEDAYTHSGGHNQLFHLVTKMKETEYLSNPYLLLALKTLLQHFSYAERKLLEKIAFGKSVFSVPDGLLQIRVVKHVGGTATLFSPLVKEFLRSTARIALPAKEARLFQMLKKREGKIVLKEELFKALWSEEDEQFGSDWALNALLYRLRKHPAFIAKGYSIENYKKIGYMLQR